MFADQDHGEEIAGHRYPGGDRRDRRPANTECRRAEVTIDKHPVHHQVRDVGGDERDHHRPHDAHSLQIAPERRIQQERHDAPREHFEVRLRQAEHPGIESPPAKVPRESDHDRGRRHRHNQAHDDAVQQPAMAVLETTGAERLRHQRIEAEQQAHRKDDDAHEQRAADTDGADGFRAQPSDHERVHHAHGHPSELRHHDWHGQGEHRPEFLSEVAETRQHGEHK
jgi:hypothetical protein